MVQDIRILGTGQLLELQRKLRAAGHENIRASMQRRIRRSAEPLRDDLQSTLRGLPIRSEGRKRNKHGVVPHGGASPTTRPLRATLASAIRISVRATGTTGARIWVDRSALPPDLKGMVKALNDPSGRVRHPVMGNKKRWVNQWVTPPMWWDKTVRSHRDRITREMAHVVDDVRRKLE